jgi:hypothetical protein
VARRFEVYSPLKNRKLHNYFIGSRGLRKYILHQIAPGWAGCGTNHSPWTCLTPWFDMGQIGDSMQYQAGTSTNHDGSSRITFRAVGEGADLQYRDPEIIFDLEAGRESRLHPRAYLH